MRLLPVEYLPDDYKGPNAGTEKEIIGYNSQAFFHYSAKAELCDRCCLSVCHSVCEQDKSRTRLRMSTRHGIGVGKW